MQKCRTGPAGLHCAGLGSDLEINAEESAVIHLQTTEPHSAPVDIIKISGTEPGRRA